MRFILLKAKKKKSFTGAHLNSNICKLWHVFRINWHRITETKNMCQLYFHHYSHFNAESTLLQMLNRHYLYSNYRDRYLKKINVIFRDVCLLNHQCLVFIVNFIYVNIWTIEEVLCVIGRNGLWWATSVSLMPHSQTSFFFLQKTEMI